MRKTKADTEKTRQQLLNAALESFFKNGVTNTSMQAIAEEAGMTRGALYWHFKNKEDLFEALFEQHFVPFVEKLNTVTNNQQNAWEQLQFRFNELFSLLEQDEHQRKFCNILHLKFEHSPKNTTITELAQRYYNCIHQQIQQILLHCQQQGHLPPQTDILLASLLLKSTLAGLISIWVENPDFSLTQIGKIILKNTMDTLQHHTLTTLLS